MTQFLLKFRYIIYYSIEDHTTEP